MLMRAGILVGGVVVVPVGVMVVVAIEVISFLKNCVYQEVKCSGVGFGLV